MIPTPRTLKDYRPQHDDDCDFNKCAGCGLWNPIFRVPTTILDHFCKGVFTPKPCTCGLDALLAVEGRDEKKDHRVVEELQRLKPHVEKWKTADGREVRSRMANDILALIDARIEAVSDPSQLEAPILAEAGSETLPRWKGYWNNWIAPFHGCPRCGKSLNWQQTEDALERPLIHTACCGINFNALMEWSTPAIAKAEGER